jgi:hypothetical protein
MLVSEARLCLLKVSAGCDADCLARVCLGSFCGGLG